MREWNYLKYLWIVTLISAFFGTYLSWSEVPSIFAYRLLLVTHTLLFGLLLLVRLGQGQKKWNFKADKYFIFFILWLTWGLCSLLWAPSPLIGMKHWIYLLSGCFVVFFTVFHFTTLRDLKMLFLIYISILVFEICLGLWEQHSGMHVIGSFPQYYLRKNDLPIIGTFGHPNNFATYLSMYLPLLYVWGKYHSNKIVMFASWSVLLLGMYLIIFSTSRANMMAMMIGIAVALALSIINNWTHILKVFLAGSILLTIVVGILLSANPVVDLPKTQLTQEVMSVYYNWEYDGSINVRKTLILKGLDMLQKSFGFGVGPGNSQYLMQQYQEETFGFIKMHNWWIEVLVDYGAIIWMLLLLFIVKLLCDLYKIYRSGQQELKMWAEGFIISICAFSVGVISNGSMMTAAHMWILYGSALAVIYVNREMKNEGR